MNNSAITYAELRKHLFALENSLARSETELSDCNQVLTDPTGSIAYRVKGASVIPCSLANAPLYAEAEAVNARAFAERSMGRRVLAVNIEAALRVAIFETKKKIDAMMATGPKLLPSAMPKCQRRAIMARTPTIDTRDLFRGTATLVVYDAGRAVEDGDEAEECLSQRHFIKCFMGQEYLRKGSLNASRLPR